MLRHVRGEYAEAIEAYEQSLRLRPNAAATHRNLGDALLRVGRRANAHRACVRAIELVEGELSVNPSDPRRIATSAVYLAKAGDIGAALERADRAASLAPADAQVAFRQAVTLALGMDARTIREDEDLAPLRSRPGFPAAAPGGR